MAAVAGALVGYGQTQAKVDALVKEQERQGRMVDAIYQRSLYAESGRSGPAIPLPTK